MPLIGIVDDDKDSREIFTTLLEQNGYFVRPFSDAADLLIVFEPGLLALILTDLSMPEMDGYELIAKIREKDSVVPVIAVTALAYEVDKQRARTAGFSDFVTKPIIVLHAFLNLIGRHVAKGSK